MKANLQMCWRFM